MKSKIFKVSKEYFEYVIVNESEKLVNMRCLDLGYTPYNKE